MLERFGRETLLKVRPTQIFQRRFLLQLYTARSCIDCHIDLKQTAAV